MKRLFNQLLILMVMGMALIVLAFIILPPKGWWADELQYARDYPHMQMAARKGPQPLPRENLSVELSLMTTARPIAAPPPQTKQVIQATQTAQATQATKAEKLARVILQKIQVWDEREALAPTLELIAPAAGGSDVTASPPPQHQNKDAALGYDFYAQGDYDQAIRHFTRALKTDPNNKNLIAQLAYAHKKAHHNDQAVYWFKQAIDRTTPHSQAAYQMRREVEQLQNRFALNGYWTYRQQAIAQDRLFLTGPSLAQSQAGIEGSYQPAHWGYHDGRQLQMFSRLLWAVDKDSLNLQTDSTQAGLGLRIRPLKNHNLWLSAERLIAVGDLARNDWMLRLSYSHDTGTDWQENTPSWFYSTLYGDIALIRPQHPEWLLSGQWLGGINYRMAQGWTLRPHMLINANWQDDPFYTTHLIEAGPGLSLKYWFNDSPYEAYRGGAELIAQYRIKLDGDSAAGSGWTATLLLNF